ncbi:MAG: YdeI/OmpD-associated family protein [Polyangia bacterium]
MAPELPIATFEGARALAAWLATHHASSTGVWLKLAKKSAGTPSVSYAEAVEVALTFGWIDGQKRPLDADWWLQKLTPRGARSAWSKINRDKAEALIAAGKMKPSGQREIDRAKTDGRWAQAYDSHRTSTVPDDLARALAANKRAAAFFEIIDAANRYAILYRVQTAKKPETRADRIARLVAMLAKKETLHPLKKKR